MLYGALHGLALGITRHRFLRCAQPLEPRISSPLINRTAPQHPRKTPRGVSSLIARA